MSDITVTGVDRGTLQMDSNFALAADVIATRSEPNPDLELLQAPVYNLVIDHPDATILWDTGVHPEAGAGHWPPGLFDAYPVEDAADHPLEADLDAAGYDLADVDAVVQSHLHMDHAGGLHNFAGTDVPIYVHEDELAHAYLSSQTRAGSAGYLAGDFHHDLDWRLVRTERESHFEGIDFVTLPGHTPGTMGLELEAGGEHLLFTSDLADTRENWAAERPPGPGLVWNQQAWIESLTRAKDRARRTDATVIFGHDPDQRAAVLAGWD